MAKNNVKKLPIKRATKDATDNRPRYFRQQEVKVVVPVFKGSGNPCVAVTHSVAVLDAGGNYVPAEPPANGRVRVTETYVWNQDHRTARKANKGLWQIPEKKELQIFKVCRRFGWAGVF